MNVPSKYVDANGLRAVLLKIKELIEQNNLPYDLLVELLEQIVEKEEIQKLMTIHETYDIAAGGNTVVAIPVNMEAYEIKTVEATNISSNSNIQVEIHKNSNFNQPIFKSKDSTKVYTNTGGVCNIDKINKSLYVKISNLGTDPASVTLEINLVNLIAGSV